MKKPPVKHWALFTHYGDRPEHYLRCNVDNAECYQTELNDGLEADLYQLEEINVEDIPDMSEVVHLKWPA